MIRVVILGFGNVGWHLATAFHSAEGVELLQIYNRSEVVKPDFLSNIQFSTSIDALQEADVYILAMPDDCIREFSDNFSEDNKFIVHTSGSVPLTELSDCNRRGVFYPLQTFSKGKSVNFLEIPVCIEAENREDLELLTILGERISRTVRVINSEARASIHLAAVFVNNFSNHMYRIAMDFLEEKELDFSLLKPLIYETAKKIATLAPSEAQTGPAKRNDLKTIKKHLNLLGNSDHRELYSQITRAIQSTYGKKL